MPAGRYLIRNAVDSGSATESASVLAAWITARVMAIAGDCAAGHCRPRRQRAVLATETPERRTEVRRRGVAVDDQALRRRVADVAS